MSETHDTTAPTIAGYAVERLIGRGGMGQVFRAFDPRLERPVALKVLSPGLADDEAFRERLVRESRLAASLDHPNVVPVYDAGEADGTLFIAMRYVDGTDLRRLLGAEGPLAPERAVAITGQIAGALDAAHARGLVHRDVKPSNVLIDHADGREHCYLADFGLTQSVANRPATDGELMGTVDYVAPEQIRGDPVDGRADVYALGCLLYESLTGELPFGRSSDVATIFAHLEEEPAPASRHAPELPREIDAVLARAIARDREDRYDTCSELVADARTALGVGAASHGPSRRMLVVLALVVLGVLAALLAAVVLTGGSASPPPPAGSLVRIDAASGEVVDRIGVAASPTHLDTDAAGQVWFAADGELWRLDPRGGKPIRIETVGAVHGIASLGRTVYVAREGKEIFEGVVVPYGTDGIRGDGVALLACSLTADEALGLWASACSEVRRIDVETGRMRLGVGVPIPIALPPTSGTTRWCLCDMTAGDGALWVLGDPGDPRVWRIAPPGRLAATIDVGTAPRSIAATRGAVWVSDQLEDVVLQVDTRTNRVVRRIDVGRGAAGVVAGADAVWVANELDGTVSRIDPGTGRVTDEIEVGGRPSELGFGDGSLWVGVDEG
jgi:YVTN family beta-propeller protein